MKWQLLTAFLVATVAAQPHHPQDHPPGDVASPDFSNFLNEIYTHSSFQRLSDGDHLLFGELILAAEEGSLDQFIDRVGLLSVIRLIDHMGYRDAHTFVGYLAESMGYTTHSADYLFMQNYLQRHPQHPGDRKREEHEGREREHWNGLHRLLQDLHEHDYLRSLPQPERQTMTQLVNHARDGTVPTFIQDVGYGPIFGMLNVLDPNHAHEVFVFLEHILAE